MKNFIRFSGFAFLFLINLAGGGVNAQQLTLTASDYNGFNISCFGGNNGSIDLTITGGTPPYTILWSNDQVTEDIADLPAGYYRVTVDDADTLTIPVEAEITLTEPRRMDISYQAYQYPNGYNISVYGACNGSIDLSVTEGVSPYTYSWKDGPTTEDRSAVCASTYRVIITDLNGCQASSESIFMKEPNRGDWQLDGNTSLDPNTQFIGTVDSTDLVFRTNNQERFRIGSNGQLNLGGEIFSFGGINFGDNKTIKYQPPGGGYPGIFSIGKDPSMDPFIIANCSIPALNAPLNYQFNGTIQLYGYSYLGNNLNVMEIGFDGANAIIDATGTNQNPSVNRLLLNYYCGKDVVVGNDFSGDLYANSSLFVKGNAKVGSSSTSSDYQFEVEHHTAPGSPNGIVVNNTDPNNLNSELKFRHNVTDLWAVGCGLSHNNTNNFFIYDNQTENTRLYIDEQGRVGIGTIPPTQWTSPTGIEYKLYVDQGIATRDVKVTALSWPDYVFNKRYALLGIRELELYIRTNKRLPGMPSAKEIDRNDGFEVGEMQVKLLEKVEEQALYIISLQNQIDELVDRCNKLERRK